MTDIIEGLSAIAPQYDAIFCDVWGVLHNGQEAFADAVEALMQARLSGLKVVLVTNSPKTPSKILERLWAMNVPETAMDGIITAGLTMQYSLFGSGYNYAYFIGQDSDMCIFMDPPEHVSVNMEVTDDYQKADCIVCAGPDYGYKNTPQDYELELRQLYTRNLPMYCGNPDVIVDHGEQRIYCGGAIAQAYEDMGGQVFQFGKPFPPIYQLARQFLQDKFGEEISASRILFIGDGVATDLKGAMLEDMDALFIAGGLAREELGVQDRNLDEVKLKDYLKNSQSDPKYSMAQLAW